MYPNKFGSFNYLQFIIFSMELAQHYNQMQNPTTATSVTQDAITIIDFKDSGFANLSLDFQIKVAQLLWTSYVLMSDRIYMVNMNWIISGSFKFVMPFLPQKVKDQIGMYSHGDTSWQDKLYKTVDRK
jgi:hypothetical protein